MGRRGGAGRAPLAGRGDRCNQPVGGKCVVPFFEIRVAGHGGGCLRVLLDDQVMQVFIGVGAKWFEAQVVNDE